MTIQRIKAFMSQSAGMFNVVVDLAKRIGWREAAALIAGGSLTLASACGGAMALNAFASLLVKDANGRAPGYVAYGSCIKPVGTIIKVCAGSKVSQADADAQARASTVVICKAGNYAVQLGADGQPQLGTDGQPVPKADPITDSDTAQNDCVEPASIGGGPGTTSKAGTASAMPKDSAQSEVQSMPQDAGAAVKADGQ